MNDTITVAPPGMQALQHGEENGIGWAICGNPIGGINGYATVPAGHPWTGKNYDDIDVDIHGGLTFGRDGWIGFDTAHLGDIWPGRDPFLYSSSFSNKEWTEDAVAEEAKRLARQVAQARSLEAPENEESRAATELEYLRWFFIHIDFGPAHEDVVDLLNDQFQEQTGRLLPEGYGREDV